MRINYHLDHFQAAVDSISGACTGPLNFTVETIIIAACCLLGIIWAVINLLSVSKIDVEEGNIGEDDSDDSDYRGRREDIPEKQKHLILELGEKISEVIDGSILGGL